jgi:hypothetical protein
MISWKNVPKCRIPHGRQLPSKIPRADFSGIPQNFNDNPGGKTYFIQIPWGAACGRFFVFYIQNQGNPVFIRRILVGKVRGC